MIFKALPLYTLNLALGDAGDLIVLAGDMDDDTPLELGVKSGTKSLDPDGASAQWTLSSKQMMISIPWKR